MRFDNIEQHRNTRPCPPPLPFPLHRVGQSARPNVLSLFRIQVLRQLRQAVPWAFPYAPWKAKCASCERRATILRIAGQRPRTVRLQSWDVAYIARGNFQASTLAIEFARLVSTTAPSPAVWREGEADDRWCPIAKFSLKSNAVQRSGRLYGCRCGGPHSRGGRHLEALAREGYVLSGVEY